MHLGLEYFGAHRLQHGDRIQPLLRQGGVEHDGLVAHRVRFPRLQRCPDEVLLLRAHHVVGVDQVRVPFEWDQPRCAQAELQLACQKIQHGGGHRVPAAGGARVAEVGEEALEVGLGEEDCGEVL